MILGLASASISCLVSVQLRGAASEAWCSRSHAEDCNLAIHYNLLVAL